MENIGAWDDIGITSQTREVLDPMLKNTLTSTANGLGDVRDVVIQNPCPSLNTMPWTLVSRVSNQV
jgi:hypothetical protein